MDQVADRGLWLGAQFRAEHRRDLAAFLERALRLDDAAIIRLRTRSEGLLTAWVATGFDVLASRVVPGEVRPSDLSVGADALARGLAAMDDSGYVDPGFAMDSAWRGALPRNPDSPTSRISRPGWCSVWPKAARDLPRSTAAHGPPVSLLDQEVIQVSAADVHVGLPMRCVFALTAMGFLPQSPDAVDAQELIRVRITPTWLRLDARFGSVYRRRGDPALLLG